MVVELLQALLAGMGSGPVRTKPSNDGLSQHRLFPSSFPQTCDVFAQKSRLPWMEDCATVLEVSSSSVGCRAESCANTAAKASKQNTLTNSAAKEAVAASCQKEQGASAKYEADQPAWPNLPCLTHRGQ